MKAGFFIVIIFCIFFTTTSFSYTWSLSNPEVISTGSSGYPYLLSMDINSTGALHAIYRNNTGSNVRHAQYVGGSWTFSNVGSEYNPQFMWACMDQSNNLHVSYYDATNANRDLRYLKWTASTASWQGSPTIVDQAHTVIGQYSSIAVDASGNIGMAYMDYYNSPTYYDDLWYAYYNGSWTTTGIDVNASEKDGYGTAITFDSLGNAHIVYCDSTNSDLKYATNASGSWAVSRIDVNDVCKVYGLGIVADASNNLYVCYYHNGSNFTQDLYMATYNGVSWSVEAAVTTDNVGKNCSIDLNSSGSPHVSYYNTTDKSLEVAYKVGATWYTNVVDTNAYSGQFSTALKIDASNNVHVLYLKNTSGSGYLGYAYAAGPSAPPPASYFDVNYTSPTSGNYNTTVPSMEFYSATADQSFGLNLKIYASSSQGGFQNLLADLNVLNYANISGMSCTDSNFMDSTRCVYDLNVVGVIDGNYYIDLNLYNSMTSSTDSSSGTLRIDHTAPTISSVSMNSESQLTGSNYALTATISDAGSGLDGNEIYRCWSTSSSEGSCSSASWDCHLGDMVNVSGNSYSATVSASVKDTAGVWNCKVYATDNLSLSNTGTDTETMQTTTGITLDSTTATYLGNPNSTANAILTNQGNAYILITHNGNTNIDVSVTGANFTSVGGNLDKNSQKFNTSNNYGAATMMDGTSQSILSSWSLGTYPTSNTQNVWFWLNITFNVYHGAYSSNLAFGSAGSG